MGHAGHGNLDVGLGRSSETTVVQTAAAAAGPFAAALEREQGFGFV